MAFPFGAVLGAVGSLFGGAMKDRSDRKAEERARAYSLDDQTHQVQRRVEDAKAAGIHPLAALGMPSTGSFASAIGGSSMGDAIADGAAQIGGAIDGARSSAKAGPLEAAQLRVLQSEAARNEAEAQSLLAATSRSAIAGARRDATNLSIGGVPWDFGPGDPQAALENEVGEIADLYGLGRSLTGLANQHGKAFDVSKGRVRAFLKWLTDTQPAKDFLRGWQKR